MRVGLFSYPRLVHGGGFEEYLIAFAQAMHLRGHDVAVITASAREYRALNIALNVYYRNPLFHDNSRVTRDELRTRLQGIDLHEVTALKMRRLLNGCDVVYAKNEVLDLGVLGLLNVGRTTPVVCGVHTPMWYPRALTPQARLHNALYLGRTYRALLGGVRAVHVSNEHDEQLFPRKLRWPSNRVFRIPYPYAANGAPRNDVPTRDRLRILFGGRLTQQKGIDVLIRVLEFAGNAPDADEFEFTIAGSGEPTQERRLAELAQRYPNVTLCGHVPRERMADLYAGADVSLVPSNWETFPFACLEPQGAGVPVVASDIPGCRDIVVDAETGFLVPTGDADAVWTALRKLRRWQREDPAALAAMGDRAAARIAREFAPDSIMDDLEQMLLAASTMGSART
jgi:glycosyltransferase involved in cell wall biosynthesis